MRTFGVTLEHVAPGEVALALRFRGDLTQQHGFLHAGVVAAVVDSACGYAALSLMDPGTAVLSVEFKVQLLVPAQGTSFRGLGRVVRSGRTLTVVAGEFRAASQSQLAEDVLVAVLTATMWGGGDRPDRAD
jgi:uncharacterized protein (TIGR00369 family)